MDDETRKLVQANKIRELDEIRREYRFKSLLVWIVVLVFCSSEIYMTFLIIQGVDKIVILALNIAHLILIVFLMRALNLYRLIFHEGNVKSMKGIIRVLRGDYS